jgi:hypothetical protein
VTGRRGLQQASEKYAPKFKQPFRELRALIIVHFISVDLNYLYSENFEENAESLFCTCP